MGFEKAWKRLLHALEHAIACWILACICTSFSMKYSLFHEMKINKNLVVNKSIIVKAGRISMSNIFHTLNRSIWNSIPLCLLLLESRVGAWSMNKTGAFYSLNIWLILTVLKDQAKFGFRCYHSFVSRQIICSLRVGEDFKESCPSPTMYLCSKLVLVSLGLTGYPLGIKI